MLAFVASPVAESEAQPWRELQRRERNGLIVHDGLSRRPGWIRSYLLCLDGIPVGLGSVAVAGPWAARPAVVGFFVRRGDVSQAPALFSTLVRESGARDCEAQTDDPFLADMVRDFGGSPVCEKLLFRDGRNTALGLADVGLQRVTPVEEELLNFDRRVGQSAWILSSCGVPVATGALHFHYNAPYADIHMETSPAYRRRGYGSYLVQELKRICRGLGGIPTARCDPDNKASRATLEKAGFVSYGQIIRARLN